MPLSAGTRVGPYEVTGEIGVGGMGEVYRARDTRLNRDVALKTLPAAFTLDASRRTRFEREAQLLASLNHPNIAVLYGFEEAGPLRGLVMELVDGATLAELIAQAPRGLPLAESLAIARQIADALEAAHEHGIVHRDLKPANIKVTSGGIVKVLDFGLAKALADDSGGLNLSDSPTITSTGTQAGIVLGTAAYMSPEQARGRPVDKRTDVWAFGCVLYEMLTGRRAFEGDNVTDLLAGIVGRDVDLSALPADTPPGVVRLVRRCLEKERSRRLADIADARLEISEALEPRGLEPAPGPIHRSVAKWWLLAGAGIVVGAAAAALAGWFAAGPASGGTKRFVILAPASDPMIHESIGTQIAISPDGQHIVYVGLRAGSQLYVRPINQLQAQPIPGTTGARQPFFSPDSRFIGFWATAEGEIRRVAVTGGPVMSVAKAPSGTFYGGSWGADDAIVFGSGSLYRVPATGGTPEALTTPDPARGEVEHRWPEILPAGNAIVYTAWGGHLDRTRIDAWSFVSKQAKTLVEGATMPRYSLSGHLIYQQSGNLMATAFDAERADVSGRVASLDEQVKTTVSGAADFAIARDGTLVLMAGTSTPDRRLMWVDRKGVAQPLLDTPDDYWLPRFSPDGRRLAVGIGPDLWAVELSRLSRTRVTFGTTNTLFPYAWSRDGRHIIFSLVSNKTGLDIYSVAADGSGQPTLVAEGEHRQWAISASPVSDEIALYEQHPTTLRDIWILPPGGKRRPFLATPYQERVPRYSPDGRWIAYVSNDSGRDEVYIRSAAGNGRRMTVSTDGGSEPAWAGGGRELLYRNGSQMMSATVSTAGDELTVGRPQILFESTFEADRGSGAANPNYDVTADGQRFVMIRAPAAPTSLVVVVNWFQELAARINAGAR